MKKLFIAALAVAAFTSCSQDEVLEQSQPTAAIAFKQAFIDNATRAAVDPSITTETISAFDVWGFIDGTTNNAFEAGDVFNAQRVNKSTDNAWTYSPVQYWIPGNTYYFAALAPVDAANISVKVAENSDADLKYGLGVVSFINKDGTTDLLYDAKSVEATESMSPVEFSFKHLLSKVKFSFTNGFANANNKIIVKNVKMIVPGDATIDLAVANWWDNTNDWVLGTSTKQLQFGDINEGEELLVGTGKAESAHERLTIPAASTQEYLVTFDVELYSGNVLALSKPLSTTIKGAALEMGKAYNFHATLDHTNITEGGLKPIVFDVEEVEIWNSGNGYEGDGDSDGDADGDDRIETTVIGVSTAEQLFEALGVEAKSAATSEVNVKLLADISLNNRPLVIKNKTVNIDLNDKTLTAGSFTADGKGTTITTGSSDSYVFLVGENGVLNVYGEGHVVANEAEYSMAVWAAGGTANIYGGHYKNNSHGDLMYAKFENACINIYGGEFTAAQKQSTDEGTLDEYPALNIYDSHRSTAKINVYGGKFNNFNPANCYAEGPGTSFVAEGYVAKETSTKVYEVIPATAVQKVATANDLAIALAAGGTIKLTADITVNESLEATGVSTLDLNGHSINNTLTSGKSDVIIVRAGGDLTINDANNAGRVYAANEGNGFAIISEGKLTINGGYYPSAYQTVTKDGKTFKDGNCIIYTRHNGEAYINGGLFEDSSEDHATYLINKKDGDRTTTIISVTGGKFKYFDPANNPAEGAGTTFVADGYKSYAVDANWFAVVAGQ